MICLKPSCNYRGKRQYHGYCGHHNPSRHYTRSRRRPLHNRKPYDRVVLPFDPGHSPLPENAKKIGDCSICISDLYDVEAVNTSCGHVFHGRCLTEWKGSCPLCRTDYRLIRPDVQPPDHNVDDSSQDQYVVVWEVLRQMQEEQRALWWSPLADLRFEV